MPPPNDSRLIIALTGPIAAGKNAAADILSRRGFACIDADVLVHAIIDEQQEKILEAFLPLARERGVEILADGKIDRKALGSILFNNPEALALQERIVHPEVGKKIDEFLAAHTDAPAVINATVLYKTPDFLQRCACILYVDAPKITRFFRVKRRNHLKNRQIIQRIHSQAGIFSQYKKSTADIYKVWNIGDLNALEKKIDYFLTECEKRGYGKWNKKDFYG
jgi:dephospho-CoA kinase